MSGEAEATETYRRREYAVPCWIDCLYYRVHMVDPCTCALSSVRSGRQQAGSWSVDEARLTSSELCRSCVGVRRKRNCTTVCSG